MATLEDLYANIPTAQIAQQLGVDESTAQNAIQSVVPHLLGGLHEHTQDPEKEAALAAAIEQPEAEATTGHSLVSSLFGGDNEQVATALSSGKDGVDSGLVQKLLPILLPIVISYLSQKAGGKGEAAQSGAGGGGLLGDLIGGILSGSAGGKGGGGLGDVLGSVLGGGSPAKPEEPAKSDASGGLFGKILGGILNRNK